MTVSVIEDRGEFMVWVSLEDGVDPTKVPESFCIGAGVTLEEAAIAGRKALNKSLDDLVVMAHDRGVQVAR